MDQSNMKSISPSVDVVKSWQGAVEICLRVACTVLCLITLICAAVALASIKGADDSVNGLWVDANLRASGAGWLIFVAILCMAIEPTIIVVRFLKYNINFINQHFLIFGIVDIIISGIFGICLFAGGVANAVHASKNADAYKALQLSCESGYGDDDFCSNLKAASSSQAAAAAFSFFAMIAFGALGGIMLVTIFLKYKKSSSEGDKEGP